MAKNQRRSDEGVSPEAMVSELQDRIEYLQTLQQAILYAYYGEQLGEAEQQAQPAKRRRRARTTGNTSTFSNSELIGDILREANEPLTTAQVMIGLQSRGWKSRSKTPHQVVYVTLTKMTGVGKADGKWFWQPAVELPEQTSVAA